MAACGRAVCSAAAPPQPGSATHPGADEMESVHAVTHSCLFIGPFLRSTRLHEAMHTCKEGCRTPGRFPQLQDPRVGT